MRAFEFVMSVLTFVAMIVGGAVFAGIAALIVSVFASTGAAITTFVVLMIPAVAMALYVWLDDASVR